MRREEGMMAMFFIGERVRYDGPRYGDPPDVYGTIVAVHPGEKPYEVAWDNGTGPFPSYPSNNRYAAAALARLPVPDVRRG